MLRSRASSLPRRAALEARPIFRPDLVRRMWLAIFSGEWKAGDRLREEPVAAQFGVSRTPVREAFQELASVGLVELRPNCGAVVAAFGPAEITEIYALRAILEAEATRLACRRIPPEDLSQIGARFATLAAATRRTAAWSEAAWEADRALHEMIAEHCPNRRLRREIARYSSLVQIIRETVGNRDRAQDFAVEEHRAVIEALECGDARQAGAAMRQHIEVAGEAAAQALAAGHSARRKMAPRAAAGRKSAVTAG